MDIILGVAKASLDLFLEMSPYLLFGFFFAGILHVAFSLSTFARHLGKSSIGAVLKSVLVGIPLPLCSCGVIPSAMLLKKRGASKPAVLSFLVSTPITGIDSIFATYSLLGGAFMIFRLIACIFSAIVTGIVAIIFLPKEDNSTHVHNYPPTPDDPQCCHDEAVSRNRTTREKIVELFRYAFIELLGDIWKWLVIGVIIGGAISYLVPAEMIERYLGNDTISMLIMMLIGIPMYVCSTGSIPIAAALMMKGMSPGAALVFLLAGPATNAVTITVVAKELGKRSVIIYVASIAVMSLIMGYILNVLWPYLALKTPEFLPGMQMLPSWVNVSSGILLTILIFISVYRDNFPKNKKDCCCH